MDLGLSIYFTSVDLSKTKDNPETHTLQYIMKENQHDFIDLLKVDVEGSEFAVLKQIVDAAKGMVHYMCLAEFTKHGLLLPGEPLPFAQLQLEIHAWFPENEISFKDYLDWSVFATTLELEYLSSRLLRFTMLEKAGLRAFRSELNFQSAMVCLISILL